MSKESYIPYEATAKVIAINDEANAEFLLSLFPESTPDQIYKFSHYVAGKIHDGIIYGQATSDEEPMNCLEAYRMGYDDGKSDRGVI